MAPFSGKGVAEIDRLANLRLTRKVHVMLKPQELIVKFKAKVQEMHYVGEDAPRYLYVNVPNIKPGHCNMSAFRTSRKFGNYANSDLFLSILKREIGRMGVKGKIRLDDIPADVTVDTSGFLAVVTITLPDRP